MATDKPRFTITLSDEIFAQVMDYKKEMHLSTQSKAIQQLVALGLQEAFCANPSREADYSSFGKQAAEIAHSFSTLDAHGKKVVRLLLAEETDRITSMRENDSEVLDLGTIRHFFYSPAAGPDGLNAGEDFEEIPRTLDMPKNADYCLTISGDSMEPYIHAGDTIFISTKEQVREMEVGVWFFQGGTYVKQYSPSYDGSVYLLSANPAREAANVYIPREATPSLICFGKVLGLKKLPAPQYDGRE